MHVDPHQTKLSPLLLGAGLTFFAMISSCIFSICHSRRMKEKLVCYDIDGTLTKEMLFVPLIKSEYEHGIIDETTYVSLRDVLKKYNQGEIECKDAVQPKMHTA